MHKKYGWVAALLGSGAGFRASVFSMGNKDTTIIRIDERACLWSIVCMTI
jgi:hypothetical protein